MKRKISLFGTVILIILVCAMSVSAASGSCKSYQGGNIGRNGYYDWYNWSQPVLSYLTSCSDGKLMRVQSGCEKGKILVEYYDADYNFKSSKAVKTVLPLFGAFYETESNYFIISGQYNLKQKSNVECFNIAKYDKNWKLIKSTGLKNCNTTKPFDAGSVRVSSKGDWLIVRTSHEMYKSEDGLNHQSNMTIQVKISTMEITDSFFSVANSSFGYCSHSFNQFVHIDSDDTLVAVDHGDAHPRSVALFLYPIDINYGQFIYDWDEDVDESLIDDGEEEEEEDSYEDEDEPEDEVPDGIVSTTQPSDGEGDDVITITPEDIISGIGGIYDEYGDDINNIINNWGNKTAYLTGKNYSGVPANYSSSCTVIPMLTIPGQTGDNYTGCTVGGFEISDTSYIVAGTCVDYKKYGKSDTKNVFISVVNKEDIALKGGTGKDNLSGKVTMLTSYKEGSASATNPHLVKITGNRFLVIWSRDNKVCYQEINAKGQTVGKVQSFKGALSDCAPVSVGSKVVWYTWDDENITFCSINKNNIAENKSVQLKTGEHKYEKKQVIKEATFSSEGKAKYVCSVCSASKTGSVPVKTVGSISGLTAAAAKKGKLTVKWSKAANAAEYEVYISTDGKKWTKAGKTDKLKYTVKGLKTGTVYRIKVRAVNGRYVGPYSSAAKAKTRLVAPSFTLKAGSKKAVVSFAAVKGASYYNISYSTDKSFKKDVKTVKVKGKTKVSKTIKNLKKGKTYYFKVRSGCLYNKKTMLSAYSKAKKAIIK